MAKESLKVAAFNEQQGKCARCGELLPKEWALVDTNRLVMRKDGGTYERKNYELLCPLCHFKNHGILKVRPEALAKLKSSVDSYRQSVKLRIKVSNQELAVKRGVDELEPEDAAMFTEIGDRISFAEASRKKAVEVWFRESIKDDPFIKAIMAVKGVGPISAAELLVDLDLVKAHHASSLWKYVGYDVASIDRYKKGEMGGGNKGLRCAMYNLGTCFLKSASPYAKFYYDYKGRLEASEKIVKERRVGDGKIIEVAWKDAKPIHRHLAAIRYMMKMYLMHYWVVGRSILGLAVDEGYAADQLGHEHQSDPHEYGWEY